MMDSLALRPDPMDYQIIQFSNACQILSCFCNLAAICIAELRDLAALIDLVAGALLSGCCQGPLGLAFAVIAIAREHARMRGHMSVRDRAAA